MNWLTTAPEKTLGTLFEALEDKLRRGQFDGLYELQKQIEQAILQVASEARKGQELKVMSALQAQAKRQADLLMAALQGLRQAQSFHRPQDDFSSYGADGRRGRLRPKNAQLDRRS